MNVRTGDVWHVPNSGWPWLAWSYDDIALVQTGQQGGNRLLSCDASRQSCEILPTQGSVLLPTN